MRTAGTVIGVIMVLMGAVWVLQGINILPGSLMTGQFQWAVYGALLLAAGLLLVWVSRRNRRAPPHP